MEPPKKRKYPEHLENVSGSCGLVAMAKVEMDEGVSQVSPVSGYGDQQHVVSNSGTSLVTSQPAKRNRRSYSLEFKVAVLDSYYNDTETRLNQRKTALKYGVNRRQIQKWLAQEETLRGSVGAGYTQNHSLGQVPALTSLTPLAPPVTMVTSVTTPSMPPTVSSTCKISPTDKRPAQFAKYPPVNLPLPMTVVEVKPEIATAEEEQNFVIDEGNDSFKTGDNSYSDEDDQYDNKPINLSKEIKVENQVRLYSFMIFKFICGKSLQTINIK